MFKADSSVHFTCVDQAGIQTPQNRPQIRESTKNIVFFARCS